MEEQAQCILCEAYFRRNTMIGNKCPLCNALYPNASTKEEIKTKVKNKAETLTEGRVKELIYELLEDANIRRIKCERCGKLFFRNSPAQKYCSNCKDKETKE